MLVLTLLAAYSGASAFGALSRDLTLEERQRSALLGVGEAAGSAFAVVGGVILALSVVTLFLTWGVWRRRGSAREGAMLVFGAFALIMIPISIAGLNSGRPDALLGLAVGVADAAVAGLLFAPSTSDDFSTVERQRVRARGSAR